MFFKIIFPSVENCLISNSGLSNGRCHLCQIRDNDETMQHLFFKCPSVNKIIKEIEAIFNRSGLTANIEIKELNIMPLEFFDLISNFDFL
jgi:hypothetical protein